MKFEHYILTRFNLPYESGYRTAWNKPEWLEMRCRIFEKIAIPSYQHQTNQNFTNLLLCSTHTKEPYKSRIKSWGLPVVWLPEVTYEFNEMESTMNDIMLSRLKEDTTHLISSLADSDDSLHEDYVKLVQEQIRPDKENILPHFGLYVSVKPEDSKVRHFTNTDVIQNMPNTIEPVDSNLITAIGRKHSKLEFPHRWIEFYDPLFIKMIDCGNIMNKRKSAKPRGFTGQDSSLEKFHMEEL